MGNRYLKTLELNNVIVGEYLGSDDEDEDIEAARDMLRAKGLYNPPSLISAMLGQADAFAYTANATYLELQAGQAAGRLISARRSRRHRSLARGCHEGSPDERHFSI